MSERETGALTPAMLAGTPVGGPGGMAVCDTCNRRLTDEETRNTNSMIEDSENKTIEALVYEEIDTMTHQLNEADLSDKRADRIMIDVNQRVDERDNDR